MAGRPRRPPPAEDALIWERPEPKERPAPGPLSRERIVRAAIQLADGDGLDAVSLRKVGGALAAGPMRLYGYLSTKEELLELMVDAIYGEMLARGPLSGDWRAVLTTVAMRLRQAVHAHPWFIALVGGRPHLGPHAMGFVEATMAALASEPRLGHIDDIMHAVRTLTAYVIGALQEEQAVAASGMDQAAWQRHSAPYIERLIATGRYPMLARIYGEARHPTADERFARGLSSVLDGIGASLRL